MELVDLLPSMNTGPLVTSSANGCEVKMILERFLKLYNLMQTGLEHRRKIYHSIREG